MSAKRNRGLLEALRLLGLPQREPTEDDRPRQTPLPGPTGAPLPGQFDLFGRKTQGLGDGSIGGEEDR
jgi:hypothetical protein